MFIRPVATLPAATSSQNPSQDLSQRELTDEDRLHPQHSATVWKGLLCPSWSPKSWCPVRTRHARDWSGETLMMNKREGAGVRRDSHRLWCRSPTVKGEREGRKMRQEEPQTILQLWESHSQVGGDSQEKDCPVEDSVGQELPSSCSCLLIFSHAWEQHRKSIASAWTLP